MATENTLAPADAGTVRLAATLYGINFTLNQETLTALTGGNYNLYGFKAVKSAQGGGAPLVWFQLPPANLSTTMALAWTEQYQAYTSTSKIISGGTVTAGFNANIDLGQTLQVGPNGTGPVVAGGNPLAISLRNTITQQFTCGISQTAADGSSHPMCAFPLYGQQLDVIAPIEKVLLLFSSETVNTGTVIEKAYGPGILVDLTSGNHRDGISYDINKGWAWGGFDWAESIQASDSLVPLLITA